MPTRKRFEDLTPEQQEAVRRVRAITSTPEYRAREQRDIDLIMDEIPPKPPEPELAALFASLKAERERRGLTLADVSALTGIDVADLSRMERGRVRNPTFLSVSRMAKALGQTITLGLRPD